MNCSKSSCHIIIYECTFRQHARYQTRSSNKLTSQNSSIHKSLSYSSLTTAIVATSVTMNVTHTPTEINWSTAVVFLDTRILYSQVIIPKESNHIDRYRSTRLSNKNEFRSLNHVMIFYCLIKSFRMD